jgi:hypothetical protein
MGLYRMGHPARREGMKVEIPFLSWTGKAALEVEISDDTEGMFWLRAALEVAVKRGANLSGANLSGADLSLRT